MSAFSRLLAVAVVGLCGAVAQGTDLVGVSGSDTQFATSLDSTVGDKPVKLVLTGTALRKKYFFNVYALGSYVQEGANVHTPEELAAADCPKQLLLVMERDLDGGDLAEAFREAIRLNYPEPAFDQELEALAGVLRAHSVEKGDQIWITHVPGAGLKCMLAGKAEFRINNVNFSKAVWDIYLGPNNLGDGIKKGLVSRLQ